MAKRGMSKKRLDLGEHGRRLAAQGEPSNPRRAWMLAGAFLGGALLLLYLLK